MAGARAQDAAVRGKLEGLKRPPHNAYANYLQYKRMEKADPTGGLKSKVKSGHRHDKKIREMAKKVKNK